MNDTNGNTEGAPPQSDDPLAVSGDALLCVRLLNPRQRCQLPAAAKPRQLLSGPGR